jgi:hypothetical protein
MKANERYRAIEVLYNASVATSGNRNYSGDFPPDVKNAEIRLLIADLIKGRRSANIVAASKPVFL